MNVAIFSTDVHVIDSLVKRLAKVEIETFTCKEEVDEHLKSNSQSILIIDYDNVSHEFNEYLQDDTLPKKVVVFEKQPSLTIGSMLIAKGVKAYGNINMLQIHLEQLLNTVDIGKVWTYPELTAFLVKKASSKIDYANHELLQRLSSKEADVVLQILNGFNNYAIAKNLNITERTVKAHISSIFKKLHINDRISLVLLLK